MINNINFKISKDSEGSVLNGSDYYRIKLPANIPTEVFWSVIVFDNETEMMIQGGQPWPSVFKNKKNLKANADGSIDIVFGKDVPSKDNYNWIQTIPGKSWSLVIHIYEPNTKENKWNPGDIKQINASDLK